MKAVVAAFNQEKALVGAFSVLTNLRMELFQALLFTLYVNLTMDNWAFLTRLFLPQIADDDKILPGVEGKIVVWVEEE